MNIVFDIAIIINILAILILGFGLIFVSKEDVSVKLKSTYGVLLATILFLYVLALLIISILGIIKHEMSLCSLLIFVIMPFLIGKLSDYYSKKKYSKVQFFCFIISLFILFSIL